MLLPMFLNILISLLVGIVSKRLRLSDYHATSLSVYTFIILWMDLGIKGWISGLIAYACYRFLRAAWESDGCR